ncbi:UNVERIFIED_CONTAM: hypothetical protein K2H54_038188 [Gekko kuhli]
MRYVTEEGIEGLEEGRERRGDEEIPLITLMKQDKSSKMIGMQFEHEPLKRAELKILESSVNDLATYKLMVSAEQKQWLDGLRGDVVIVNGNKALRAFTDTGLDFSSVPETALESPSHWLHSVALYTYDAKITNQSMVPVKVQFGKFSGEIPVIVHSDEHSKFLTGGGLYRNAMCQNGEIKIQQKEERLMEISTEKKIAAVEEGRQMWKGSQEEDGTLQNESVALEEDWDMLELINEAEGSEVLKEVSTDPSLTKQQLAELREKTQKLTTVDPYPTSRVETLIEELAGDAYISILNLAFGYW